MPIYRVTLQDRKLGDYTVYVDAPHWDAAERWADNMAEVAFLVGGAGNSPVGTVRAIDPVGAAPLGKRLYQVMATA